MIKNGKNTYRATCDCSFCKAQHPKPKRGSLTFKKRLRVEAQALKESIHYCEDCGNPKECVHHIIPLSEGGNNDLSNLKALCTPCHRKYHPDLPSKFFR